MQECRRFLVAGRVQGVFYRASTQEYAGRLQLQGWVRNLADGRVEVLALGEVTALDQLAEWLWQGPPLAQVDSVDITPQDYTGQDDIQYTGFQIR